MVASKIVNKSFCITTSPKDLLSVAFPERTNGFKSATKECRYKSQAKRANFVWIHVKADTQEGRWSEWGFHMSVVG